MKKFFKNLVIYFGVFVVAIAITAGVKVGMFFITHETNSGNIENQETQDNTLTKVLNSMLGVDNAGFDLDLQLNIQENSPLKLSSKIFLDMPSSENEEISLMSFTKASSSSGLKINFVGTVEFDGRIVEYNISYVDNFLYLKLGDTTVKAETDNIMTDLNTIINFAIFKKFGVNVSLPDLSGFSFGPELLTSLAGQLTETDLENDTKEIKFNIMGYGWAVLTTSKDYELQNVILEDFSFNGTTISADVKANLKPEPLNIVAPENSKDMTDLSGLTQFLQVVDNLAEKGEVGGTIDLNIFGTSLIAEYSVNFKDFNNISIYLKTKLANNIFEINFQNGNAYLSYGGFKYFFESPFDFTELVNAFKFYAEKFGIKLPEGEFQDLIDSINVSDLNQILKQISNLKVDETGLNYSYKGLVINLSIEDNKFNKLIAYYKDIIKLDIDLNKIVEVPDIDTSEYKDMLDEKLFKILHEQLIINKNLSVLANLNINNTPFDLMLKADFKDETKIQLTAKILNKNLTMTIIDKDVYLEFDTILKAKGTIDEIAEFIKNADISVLKSFDLDKNTIQDLVFTVLNNPKVALNLLKEDGVVNAFEVTETNVYCKITAIEYTPIEFTESENYEKIIDIAEFAKTLIKNIANKTLAFEFNANYKNYQIVGKLQYINEKFSAIINTEIYNKVISIEVDNNEVYLNIDGLKILCDINELTEIGECLSQAFGFENIANENLEQMLSELLVSLNNGLLNINYNDIVVSVNAQELKANVSYNDLTAIISMTDSFELSQKQNYLDFTQLKSLLKATINTIKNKSISGNIDVVLKLFDEDNHVKIDYAVSFENNQIIGKIFTKFKGLNINAYINNKDIYFDIVGLKIHFNIDQLSGLIDWLNSEFNAQIPEDFKDLFLEEKLQEIHFDIIRSVTANKTSAKIEFNNDLIVTLDFDSYIKKVIFGQGSRSAIINCTNFDEISFADLNTNEYKEYTLFTDLIQTTLNLLKSKKYDIFASIQQYSNNTLTNTITSSLELDTTDGLNAYLNILGLKEQITLGYENKVMYLCYGGENGLKISIQEKALQKILTIVLNALNVDSSKIPLLNEFLEKDNLDTSNLENIMPKIDIGNPLDYLEYIQAFTVTDSCFEITLKAEKLGDYANGKDITIRLNYINGKITSMQINNLFTNSSVNEFINVSITLNNFASVKKVLDKDKYIDISNSKDLLNAFVNTSNLTDWHIVGNVKLNIALGSLKLNAAKLGVDVKVKLDDNKKPLMAIELTKYPLIGGLNDKNTNGVGGTGLTLIKERFRTISIYIKDGEIVLKTVDEKWGAYKELTRTTKITLDSFINNLSYYTQYLFGFTDTIQAKINEAIEKSMSYQGETNYGEIIKQYSLSNNAHTFVINLAELVHNSEIGTLTLILTTQNDDSVGNKDYISRMDIDLKILDDMLAVYTDKSNSNEGLYLTDIGVVVDLSKMNEFLDLYNDKDFALDGEYEKQGDKSWKKANTGNSEIVFVSQGKTVQTVLGEVASKLTFPQMDNYFVDDKITLKEYSFVGWFYDEDLTMQFNLVTFPKYNTTLFAKWEEINAKTYAKIEFITNQSDVIVESKYGFVGETYELPVCQNIVINVDENTTILKTFIGWFTIDGKMYNQEKFTMPNLTLYAHWNEKQTTVYSVKIVSKGQIIYENKVEKDTVFDIATLEEYKDTTLVYSSSNFEEVCKIEDFTITTNTIWYLRNKFNVVIKSDYTTKDGNNYYSEVCLYEGEIIQLPQYANYSVDNGTYSSDFVFNGYNMNGNNIQDTTIVIPYYNCEIVANWTENQWCIVTFDVNAWVKPSWWTPTKLCPDKTISVGNVSNTNNTNKIKIKRGEKLDFNKYVAKCTHKYGVTYNFKTAGWATEVKNVYDGDYNETLIITENMTVKPVWKQK